MFQYISDIHLEHYKIDKIKNIIPKKISPYLILCGDIGYPYKIEYKYFLDNITNIWDKIFIITGNHEYYQIVNKYRNEKPHSICEIDEYIENLCKKYNNIFFLNEKSYEININDKKYILIGTPLFSYIPNEYKYYIWGQINDFNYIYIKKDNKIKKITPDDYNEIYNNKIKWLENEINKYNKTENKIIVITHYAPSEKCIDDKYKIHTEMNYAYYSNCEYLINNLYCWIHGHTHSQKEIEINQIKILNNSIGYIDEIDKNIILEKNI
jgi:predicted phosphodiesterase